MTTTEHISLAGLAAELDVTVETIETLASQISEDVDLFDPETDTLTPAGVEVITAQVATSDDETPLADIEDVVQRIGAVRSELDGLLDERDGRIRRALHLGMSYASVGVVAGISRSALDTIRRGERSRSAL